MLNFVLTRRTVSHGEGHMLAGKTTLITGSTSGIGKSIAIRLAEAGCNVVLNGFGDGAEIENFRTSLERDYGVSAMYQGADLTSLAEIEQMFSDIENELGPVEILVNNAGTQHVSPVESFPVSKWDLIIAAGNARHAEKGLGPDHQYGLSTCARRIALQVCLCCGKTRDCRSDEGRCA